MNDLIKVNSFKSEKKRVIIKDNFIEFNGQTLYLDKVIELKYGFEPIQVEMFTIGNKYVLELKNPGEQFKVVLKCYFGISSKYFNKIFNQIIHEIWQQTGSRLIDEAKETIMNGGIVNVGKCTITMDGVSFKNNFIAWENLSYQRNYDRLTLNNKSNYKIWTNLYYLETFNFDVMNGILHWIFKEDGLKEIEETKMNNFKS